MDTNLPGFSKESLNKVGSLLYGELNWSGQFISGKGGTVLPRENKTTLALGLQHMDIDSRKGKQLGDEGKQKKQSSESISPVSLPKGNPQQGPRSRSDLTGLRMFDEASCSPGQKPRSTEQKQATQQAQESAQQQNQTFDKLPQQQVKDLASQGGQAERKKPAQNCSKPSQETNVKA